MWLSFLCSLNTQGPVHTGEALKASLPRVLKSLGATWKLPKASTETT